VLAAGVEAGGHRVEAVWVGRPDHRAEVAVADRKRARQCPVEVKVRPQVVAHRVRAALPIHREVSANEPVHCAFVPVVVLGTPVVADVGRALSLMGGIHMERIQVTAVGARRVPVDRRSARDRLREYAQPAAVAQLQRVRISEAAYAREGAEVVIKRAVLLDQDDDVLDVRELAAAWRRGERPLRRLTQSQPGQRGRAGTRLEELPAGERALRQDGHRQSDFGGSDRWLGQSPRCR